MTKFGAKAAAPSPRDGAAPRRPLGAWRLGILTAALVAAGMLPIGPASRAAASGDDVKQAFTAKLPNVPGKSLTAIVVNYAPGGKSKSHHHSGSVFAYVLSGAIRSENSATGPVRVYKAGESFFEPPGSRHLISENASATEPASLLAVFIADDGAHLTTFDK
jgi:quercetin dioxygenase-like cupin family protein